MSRSAAPKPADIVLRIRENPVINRVLYEGNKRLKEASSRRK